ncbi:hypothetical protein M404DRAFT_1003988 [Pisolithus tinctorius Marx 270]|uniref:Uncharacterized protein n=1 Tax=Pisolithus tinctorius Marx 270 TaxID=870435 RepID=A0A0C3JS27_PISTI|nr:hypothetical protein M404DRAFT_1003988 [Pisolithus tinctorius Marx 270]
MPPSCETWRTVKGWTVCVLEIIDRHPSRTITILKVPLEYELGTGASIFRQCASHGLHITETKTMGSTRDRCHIEDHRTSCPPNARTGKMHCAIDVCADVSVA